MRQAQGVAVPSQRDRKTCACTQQPETREQRRAGQKGLSLDGNGLSYFKKARIFNAEVK